jgi:hypothetical protein
LVVDGCVRRVRDEIQEPLVFWVVREQNGFEPPRNHECCSPDANGLTSHSIAWASVGPSPTAPLCLHFDAGSRDRRSDGREDFEVFCADGVMVERRINEALRGLEVGVDRFVGYHVNGDDLLYRHKSDHSLEV